MGPLEGCPLQPIGQTLLKCVIQLLVYKIVMLGGIAHNSHVRRIAHNGASSFLHRSKIYFKEPVKIYSLTFLHVSVPFGFVELPPTFYPSFFWGYTSSVRPLTFPIALPWKSFCHGLSQNVTSRNRFMLIDMFIS